jgi:hypothetical protein
MPKSRNINRGALTYVALRRLKVGASWRNPGDAVPEAAGWRNLHNYLSSGQLKVVGIRTNNPNIKQGKFAYTQTTKPAGNKPYTNYRPVSDDLTPASVPLDQT